MELRLLVCLQQGHNFPIGLDVSQGKKVGKSTPSFFDQLSKICQLIHKVSVVAPCALYTAAHQKIVDVCGVELYDLVRELLIFML